MAFADVIRGGGVALFPTDTVYGIACDPNNVEAGKRMYELKGRAQDKPVGVMYFSLSRMLDSLDEMGARSRAAAVGLLPGPYTLVVNNPRQRFAPACGSRPEVLGLRVPLLARELESLTNIPIPVMQTSANLAGQPDAQTLAAVAPEVAAGVDIALDGGTVGGTSSTVVDLMDPDGWRCLRRGSDAAYERAVVLLGEPLPNLD